MFRFLIRLGVIALVVLSLSTPAQALPLHGEDPGFTFSLSEVWERLTASISGLRMSRGTCDPNGGGMTALLFGPCANS
jgi:hypothetical protein